MATGSARNGRDSKPGARKKFKCSQCDRAFTRSEHRARHEFSHSDSRPFGCQICTSSFVRRDLLLRHMRTVHSETGNKANAQRTQPAAKIPAANSEINGPVSMGVNNYDPLYSPASNGSASHRGWGPLPTQYQVPIASSTSTEEVSMAMFLTEMHNLTQANPDVTMEYLNLPPLSTQELDDLLATKTATSSIPSGPENQRVEGPDGGMLHLSEIDVLSVPHLQPEFDVEMLLKILRQQPGIPEPPNIPTRTQLQRYVSAYFSFVHPLHPILHPQTFRCSEVNPALFFAIVAFGASVCHEVSVARLFSYNTRLLLSLMPRSGNSDPPPLSKLQAFLVILVHSFLDGIRANIEVLSTMLASTISATTRLVTSVQHTEPTTWAEWIHKESCIRVYWQSFILFQTTRRIFDMRPTIDPVAAGLANVELPCSEWLWNGTFQSEEQWRAFITYERQTVPPRTYAQILEMVDQSEPWPPLAPFTHRIAITVLVSGDYDFSDEILFTKAYAAADPHPGLGQCGLSIAVLRALSFFGGTLNKFNGFHGSHIIAEARNCRHPLILASLVLMDLASVSRIVDMNVLQKNLEYMDPPAVAQAMIDCVYQGLSSKQIEMMLPGALRAIHCLTVLFSLGPHIRVMLMSMPTTFWVAEIMALSLQPFVSTVTWIHSVTSSKIPHQQRVLAWINRAARDVGIEPRNGSLAAGFAATMASCYESLRPWGLFELMAESFRKLAAQIS